MATAQTPAPAAPAAPAATAAPVAAAPAPTAAPVAAESGTAAEDSSFDDEFARLSSPLDTTPVSTPAPTPAPTAPPAPATPEPTAAPQPEGVDAALAEQVRQLSEQLNALKTATAAPAAPEPTPAPTPAPTAPPLYSADEETTRAAYLKEWPEVAAGEALQRRAEYAQLVQYIFGQIAPRLEALSETATTTASHTQYAQIKGLVSDYDEVRTPVMEWIGKQPAYLRAAFEEVASTGTPEDIKDMIDRFRKETNYVAASTPAPTAAPRAAAPAAPAVPALSPAAAAAAATLRPVTAGRTESALQGQPDPNDFDGAFKEFTETLK